MLSISGVQLVLWLHVVAACIWIGGQDNAGGGHPLAVAVLYGIVIANV